MLFRGGGSRLPAPIDASDDGVSVVSLTGAVDADESWSMCDLELENFLASQ